METNILRLLSQCQSWPCQILFHISLWLQYLNGLQNIRILELARYCSILLFSCNIWMGYRILEYWLCQIIFHLLPFFPVAKFEWVEYLREQWATNIWHLTLKSWKGVYWESFIQTQYETALTFHQLDRTWPALVLSLCTIWSSSWSSRLWSSTPWSSPSIISGGFNFQPTWHSVLPCWCVVLWLVVS